MKIFETVLLRRDGIPRNAFFAFCWAIYQRVEHFANYLLIGASGTLLDFGTFALLNLHFGVNHFGAQVCASTVGMINNFIWNAKFNFKKTDRLFLRFCSFAGVAALGLGIAEIGLFVTINLAGLHPMIGKCITEIFVTLTGFTVNKFVTFYGRKKAAPAAEI
ncbi:MAG: GtrA family protein [Victivallaceae bacterium]|nr:GtrA family protein [Victivallaceae bacterium]